MTTKYDIGDEITLKLKVAAIHKDLRGTSYMFRILAANGENDAGHYLHFDQDMVEKIARTDYLSPIDMSIIDAINSIGN